MYETIYRGLVGICILFMWYRVISSNQGEGCIETRCWMIDG